MSRAFVKNELPDEPPLIPPRPPLPAGTPNYVTPRGLALLHDELAALEAERARLPADAAERDRRLAVLAGRLADLRGRLASATVVDNRGRDEDAVRFGATVSVRTLAGRQPGAERRYTIVGVDEASAGEGRVAFTAPLARALLGRKPGERATLNTAHGEELLEIEDVDYR